MAELSIKHVEAYLSGDYKHAPKCSICSSKICYIVVVEKSISHPKKIAYAPQNFLSTWNNQNPSQNIMKSMKKYMNNFSMKKNQEVVGG